MEGFFLFALISLLALPLISISTAPGIFGGLLLFSSLAFIFKQIDRQVLSRAIFYILSFGAFMILIYYCRGNLSMNHTFSKNLLSYTDISTLDYRSIKIFVAEVFYRIKNSLIHLFLLYAPFIVLTVWIFYKKRLRFNLGALFIMISCICLISLLFYQLFYKMKDSWQFYTNNLTLFNIIIILFLIIALFEKSETIKWRSLLNKIIFGCTLLLLFARGYNALLVLRKQVKINNNLFSATYLTEIQKCNLNKKEKLRGAVIYNATRFYPVESEVQANITPYLSFMPQYLPCFYLGDFEHFVHDDSNKVAGSENNNAEYSIFYQFIESQKKENTYVNLEQSQSDFIEKYEIKYLVVAENTNLSNKILEKADKIIIDQKSKQKFILLQ